MLCRELVIRVRFEPGRAEQRSLRTAFELVLPVRRRTLRKPPSHQVQLGVVAELPKKEQTR